MVDLDDLKVYEETDPQEMRSRITEMSRQIEEANALVTGFPEPGPEYRAASNIVVLGMGGSAIGGDLVRTIAEAQCAVPIVVSRDYHIPAFVGPDTLVIASSYSGNTEETLSAVDEALESGAKLIAITTGGTIAGTARSSGFPILRFQYEAQPRAALGFSFGLLLGLLVKLGYVDASSLGMEEAISAASSAPFFLGPEVPTENNAAKQLAQRLYGRLPVVYGAGILSEIARRWKGQINENAKAWAFFEQFPELNHNAVVGYENPQDLGAAMHVVMLSSSYYHPRVAERLRITAELLARQEIAHEVVEAKGEGPAAQMMDAIAMGDYTSYYLAILYGTDPTPVKSIDFLKGELARIR